MSAQGAGTWCTSPEASRDCLSSTSSWRRTRTCEPGNGTWDFTPSGRPPEGQPIFRDHDPDDLLLLQSPIHGTPRHVPVVGPLSGAMATRSRVRDYLQMRAGACALGVPTSHPDIDWEAEGTASPSSTGRYSMSLADDAIVPHKSLLMSHRFDEHDTVYADLFRKRGASATETKAGEHSTRSPSSH